MFWIIPVSVIGAATISIGIVVSLKFQYLRRLTPEAHDLGPSLFHDMFPEVVTWYRAIPFVTYRQNLLREAEKTLRSIRLFFSRFERLSGALAQRVRRQHLETALEVVPESREMKEEKPATVSPQEIKTMTEVELHQVEQELIIGIAQNPKNTELYERLGDTYVQLENIADARQSYETALRLEPNRPGVERKLAKLQPLVSISLPGEGTPAGD